MTTNGSAACYIEDSDDEVLLRRLWAIIDQVRDVFMMPELIEGIFTNK